VMDRIESLPRTRELRQQPGMPPLRELRRRIGPELSDEAFLLRATMPAGQVDAMEAAGPAQQTYDPDMAPVMSLLRRLTALRDIAYLSVEKSGFKLELRGQAGPVEA
jgi:oxaloacetate decarboxylase alpha subunit